MAAIFDINIDEKMVFLKDGWGGHTIPPAADKSEHSNNYCKSF